jgi:hypothetical protein
MPQQSLFGGWAITDLRISVHLEPGIAGGRITAEVIDENGKRTEQMTTTWRAPRDVSDLPQVIKEVVNAWLWAEHGAVSSMLSSAARVHLPKVPAVEA